MLRLCEMVKLEEIKDMPKGTFYSVEKHDHLQGNNHEILWVVCGRDYANLLGIGLMKCDEVSRRVNHV